MMSTFRRLLCSALALSVPVFEAQAGFSWSKVFTALHTNSICSRVANHERLLVPTILGYHDITGGPSGALPPAGIGKPIPTSDIALKVFRDQIHQLQKAGYQFVSLSDYWNALQAAANGRPQALQEFTPKKVIVTFDDGYQGQWDAFQFLRKEHIPATFFVITNFVGKDTAKKHLTWDELHEIAATPGFSVQSHTANHPNLAKLNDATKVDQELRDSLATLVGMNLANPRIKGMATLAYPEGSYDETVSSVAARYYDMAFGYSSLPVFSIYTAYHPPLRRDIDPCYQIPRFPVGKTFENPKVLLFNLSLFKVELEEFTHFAECFVNGDANCDLNPRHIAPDANETKNPPELRPLTN